MHTPCITELISYVNFKLQNYIISANYFYESTDLIQYKRVNLFQIIKNLVN